MHRLTSIHSKSQNLEKKIDIFQKAYQPTNAKRHSNLKP